MRTLIILCTVFNMAWALAMTFRQLRFDLEWGGWALAALGWFSAFCWLMAGKEILK